MEQIVQLVSEANPTRNFANLHRRIIKLGEEYGEVSEAYLNVTSASNGKGLSWDDVREELVDVLIVAIDVALTVLEGERARPDDIKADLKEAVRGLSVGTAPLEGQIMWLLVRIGALADAARGAGGQGGRHSNIRQQATLMVISAVNVVRMTMPDQEGLPQAVIDNNIHTEVVRKLAKWQANRDTGRVATDAE